MGLFKNTYDLGKVEVGFIVFIVVALLGAGLLAWNIGRGKQDTVSSFAECVAAGNPVMESFPEQCSANGQTWSNPDQKAPVLEDVGTLPTESWATYNGIGLSLKHPNTWAESEELESSTGDVDIVSSDFEEAVDLVPSVGAGYWLELYRRAIDDVSFQSYEDHLINLSTGDQGCDGDYSTTQVSGIPAIVSDIKCHGSYRTAYIYHGDEYYAISLHGLDEDTEDFKRLFATILSTVTING